MIRQSLLIAALLASLAAPAAARDATQANKATAARVFRELFNQGRYDAAREIYAPDFRNHALHRDADLATDQAALRGWREAAPDLVTTVDQMIAEGDRVAVLWHGSGASSAGGPRLETRGITIWRFRAGRIVEEWSEFRAPSPVP
jgi:predicted SnoaL-like aldol condensation-catalyzing enzyme